MAFILCAWELGGGSGHCVNLVPIIDQLSAQGYRICAAMRDLRTAKQVFGDLPIQYFRAPARSNLGKNIVTPARNFANVLKNAGFNDSAELQPRVSAWREIINQTQPS